MSRRISITFTHRGRLRHFYRTAENKQNGDIPGCLRGRRGENIDGVLRIAGDGFRFIEEHEPSGVRPTLP
jgi:hypothetical protein